MKEILLLPITYPANVLIVLLIFLFRGELDLAGSVMFLVIQAVVTTLIAVAYFLLAVYLLLNI
jgi:hypothetical protein